MNTYIVGTFVDEDRPRPIKRSHVLAYLRTYNPAWEGCVEFEVTTNTGKEAKRIAILHRVAKENEGDEPEGEFV